MAVDESVMVNGEPVRVVTVTLHFQAIDMDECVLDCDGGCSNQAAYIAFTNEERLDDPAIAFCGDCLRRFEAHGAAQRAQEGERA